MPINYDLDTLEIRDQKTGVRISSYARSLNIHEFATACRKVRTNISKPIDSMTHHAPARTLVISGLKVSLVITAFDLKIIVKVA